jgi:hypothetical protein
MVLLYDGDVPRSPSASTTKPRKKKGDDVTFSIDDFEILAYEDFYTSDVDGDALVDEWVAFQPRN